ncbi:hypothetical protein KSU1_A0027 [Candidatus Jettenia caeni]|uniref:Uncharacterized protein n=1 Tax=Candidatus Jettenia caeni TaxID=247490 RepID=I3IGE9_9BACT|nr:hypothetical protein KSU1_A0027 [Candidatus Jettenia caeni]
MVKIDQYTGEYLVYKTIPGLPSRAHVFRRGGKAKALPYAMLFSYELLPRAVWFMGKDKFLKGDFFLFPLF